ncbi:MAG TPA: hypothetical protein PLK77_10400, partial [Pyrinomonadaceae bacterium]|nr:hypothetical protein [Pyrinomonadaceae bacterium]
MKLRTLACLAGVLLSSSTFATEIFGQRVAKGRAAADKEARVLEDEFIRSRSKTGESHASGARE